MIGGTTTICCDSIGEDVLDTTRLLRMRVGHADIKAMQGLVKKNLLKSVKTCKIDFCEYCVLKKYTRVKFGTTIHQTKGTLDYMHSNVWGPAKIASLGGKY